MTKNSHRVPPATAPADVTLKAVVEEAVKRYAKRCWWADRADMRQEAWMVACSAARTFKPARWATDPGNGLYWYAWRAVVVQLRNYLWRESAPVTAPQRKLDQLAGVQRAPLTLVPDTAAEQALADAALSEGLMRKDIAAAVFEAIPPERYTLAREALAGDAMAARRLVRHIAQTNRLRKLHSEHS